MGFDPNTTKPEIDFPEGAAPTDLVIEDLEVGDGAEAKAGDSISAHYVGVAHSTGEEFDASWSRGAPLDFRLGVGQVFDFGAQRRRLLLGLDLGSLRDLFFFEEFCDVCGSAFQGFNFLSDGFLRLRF